MKKGFKHSEITKLKISNTLKRLNIRPPSVKGNHLSDEQKRNLSLFHKGKKLSEETKKKISLINIGKKLSKETCKKISLARKGKPAPWIGTEKENEIKQKISLAIKGEKHPRWKGGITPINKKN